MKPSEDMWEFKDGKFAQADLWDHPVHKLVRGPFMIRSVIDGWGKIFFAGEDKLMIYNLHMSGKVTILMDLLISSVFGAMIIKGFTEDHDVANMTLRDVWSYKSIHEEFVPKEIIVGPPAYTPPPYETEEKPPRMVVNKKQQVAAKKLDDFVK